MCVRVITCGGGQLKRRLRVVLRPVLQGTLHVGAVIQQQLWRGLEGGGEGGRGTNQGGWRGGRAEEENRRGDGVLQSGLARGTTAGNLI